MTISFFDLTPQQQASAVNRLRKYSKLNIETGCLEWQKAVCKGGYGRISINGGEGIYLPVHRLAYEIAHQQKLPPHQRTSSGLCVMHLCDNRKCVNPSHLKLGTNRENMKDRDNKKRQVKGERVNTNKLTVAQVIEIKKLLQEGQLSQPQIAILYNVRSTTINAINTGQNWKHLGSPEHFSKGKRKGSQHRSAKLTEEQVKTIRQLLDNRQLSYKLIAEQYNISIGTVNGIRSRTSWKHVQ